MKISKLLSLDSAPAEALLARAKKIPLVFSQRVEKPARFVTADGVTVENGLAAEERPLEVGDVLVDERGGFYVVEAAEEEILLVSGDVDLMREAVIAFTARGIRVGPTETGFSMPASTGWKETLETAGLSVETVNGPFVPVPLPKPVHDEECCCCGHHHHHHHHHGDGECCCGHHHHEDEDDDCCCGHHHHEDEGEEEGCCCGHHHHHEHEGGECCGGHHHHHEHEEEGGCCCGHHHAGEAEGKE